MRNQDCLQSYEDLKLAAVGGFAEKDEWIENVVARFLHFTPKGREDCIRTWMVANTDHPTYEWTQEAVAVLKTFESAEERSPETKPKPKPRFIHKKKDVLDKILTTLERFPQRGFSAQEISNLMHSGRALATIKRYLHELYLTQKIGRKGDYYDGFFAAEAMEDPDYKFYVTWEQQRQLLRQAKKG